MRTMRPTMVDSAPGVAALALSPDGALVGSSSRAGGVQIWDVKSPPAPDGPLSGPVRRPLAARAPAGSVWLRGLDFVGNTGVVAIGGDDGVLETWDYRSGRVLATAKFPEGIRSLAASPGGGELAVACEDGSFYLLPGQSLCAGR